MENQNSLKNKSGSLQGLVERITFASEVDGYSVIKVRAPGYRELVTAVGNFASVCPGETLVMEGTWHTHARFGRQFRVDRYETAAPSTVAGIKKYLGSGLIRGIGPKMADRIVKRFAEETLDIIENQIERLLEIEGIGKYRIGQIRKAWEEQKEIRTLMIFLRSNGASATLATRIFKSYGPQSVDIVKENPYRLAMEITGIGFLTADRLAGSLGFSADSPLRAEAGILFVLHEATEEGHVCLPHCLLIERCCRTLEIDAAILEEALLRLRADMRIKEEKLGPAAAEQFGDERAIYLSPLHASEVGTAGRFAAIQRYRRLQARIDPQGALDWVRGRLNFSLAPLQEEAVRLALREKVVVITGGPGTGKTTLVRAILAIYGRMGARVSLAAPTGRAAKKLSEATGHPAATIHRLLEFSPQLGGFQRNEQKPLSADLLIVDEISMMDIVIANHLLKAAPPHAVLVLVGDVDQLPSVGPGNVLGDIIQSERCPVIRLKEIFRQASRSRIITNAHLIRQGVFPDLRADSGRRQDFYFISREDPQEALNTIVHLCTERIPKRFGLDPMEDVQVLSPMHRGEAGSQNLNFVLQKALNPRGITLETAGRAFRINDKVMQIRNNYDKDVFNGDIGRIRWIGLEEGEIQVEFDGRKVKYGFSELEELIHAYAISIHKSQGSEYPAVVFPLLTQHFMMLQRNLLYTAVTRARKLVVIVGSKKALAIAVKNNRMQSRFSLLKERLCT
ncbi:MAG TPA: ATP-dependent RecD-like DNA helicase [Syntrophobacteraceae bacterium]|nr:ATP-dependent RecD-like DNA helicase [Syntrophobacteraceae bacterium]